MIEFSKFHPEGKRAFGMYGAPDIPEACTHANANTLLGLIIETPEALEHLEGCITEENEYISPLRIQ